MRSPCTLAVVALLAAMMLKDEKASSNRRNPMARSIAPGNLPPDHGFAARSDRIAGRDHFNAGDHRPVPV